MSNVLRVAIIACSCILVATPSGRQGLKRSPSIELDRDQKYTAVGSSSSSYSPLFKAIFARTSPAPEMIRVQLGHELIKDRASLRSLAA